jgi:hypothetical protein
MHTAVHGGGCDCVLQYAVYCTAGLHGSPLTVICGSGLNFAFFCKLRTTFVAVGSLRVLSRSARLALAQSEVSAAECEPMRTRL